ncbi:glycine cleavage system protein GcvH [Desulfurococcaceae archaeon MEX13E-LK6-19]|nr:glycine cleavage system protein GcvH [Desulfurococcaceae archaeon MEX13E-LK6-19]
MYVSEIVVEVKKKKYIIKTDRKYTKTDEWAKLEDGKIREGITDYAQKELKDIVGIELPEVGKEVKKGEVIGVIESIKATADLYAAVSGKVVEVNEKLLDQPELLNTDPYGEGWILIIEPSDPKEYDELMTPEQYAEHIKKHAEEGH